MQVYQELLVKLGAQAEEAEPPALSPSSLLPSLTGQIEGLTGPTVWRMDAQ
ncbi:MAG: hypothetical protein R3B83_10785 [Nitrospirales bacterium]|nr:hypothetical protein [Nitrospirales bacterium]